MIVDQRSADAWNLVGADRRPDAAAADRDAAIDRTRRHSMAERDNKIRIVVAWFKLRRAEIDQVMAGLAQQFDWLFTMQNVEKQHGINFNAKARFHYVALLANNR